jgi:hypothetical protein
MLKIMNDLQENILGVSAEGKITGTDYETVLIPTIALVSDHEMINTFAKFFGHMLSCELRIFKNAELEEAKKWISEN